LSLRIDIIRDSVSAAGRINRRVDAVVVEKTVFLVAVLVIADNLSASVNALGDGVSAAGGINRGEDLSSPLPLFDVLRFPIEAGARPVSASLAFGVASSSLPGVRATPTKSGLRLRAANCAR
jgi:hypothetical protein